MILQSSLPLDRVLWGCLGWGQPVPSNLFHPPIPPPLHFFWVTCQAAQVSTPGCIRRNCSLGRGKQQNQQVTLDFPGWEDLPRCHFYCLEPAPWSLSSTAATASCQLRHQPPQWPPPAFYLACLPVLLYAAQDLPEIHGDDVIPLLTGFSRSS